MRAKLIISAIFVLILAASSFAQSTSRDNPTPLNSGEISGNMNDLNRETFYSFTAGPGVVTVTVDVNAKRDNQGLLTFEVLGRDGATNVACCYGAQGNGGGTGREVATFKLAKRQVVILHTTNGPIGGGTFRIRISGATSFGGSTGGVGNGGDDRDNNNDGNGRGNRGNRDGENVAVPASGTLHIRMKNGTTKDIDLSLIRSVTVRP